MYGAHWNSQRRLDTAGAPEAAQIRELQLQMSVLWEV